MTIKEQILNSGITWINHHDCSLCGKMVGYRIISDNIYFDPSCGCGKSEILLVDWDDEGVKNAYL